MKMLKKTFLLILFLSISSCGYEAMHSKKNVTNYDFSITKIDFEGNRDFNLKMKERLNVYTLAKKNKKFSLKIKSVSQKVIFAKDLTGDPISYKNTISMTIDVLLKDDVPKILSIVKSFNYNNNTDKYALKKYEKEIKNNLAESAAQELIYKLSAIQ